MISKTYATWNEAIAEVQVVSFSLSDSIGGGTPSPEELREILIENQKFFGRSVDPNENCYYTGFGVEFEWTFLEEGIRITLCPSREWHKADTLLSMAWRAGYRATLDFEYGYKEAYTVLKAQTIAYALRIAGVGNFDFGELVDALLEDRAPQFVLECAQLAIDDQIDRQVNEPMYDYSYLDDDDDVLDPEITSQSILAKLRAEPLFDDD